MLSQFKSFFKSNSVNSNQQHVNINNIDHIIVNLPHTILKHIISHLDILDCICISLVCRKWFFERDKYLVFSDLNISLRKSKPTNSKPTNFTYLNSYKDQTESLIKNKKNGTIYVDNLPREKFYDYHITDPSVVKLELNESINKVIYSNVNRIRQPVSIDNHVYEIINDLKKFSSITTLVLKANNILSKVEKLPDHIISLELYEEIPQFLNVNCLPRYLERLTIGYHYSSISPHLAEVLPSTLKYLHLQLKYQQAIESLPKNLEELHFIIKYKFTLNNDILPLSLHTMTGIWGVEGLKNNTTLKTLKFQSRKWQELPTTLTELAITIPEEFFNPKNKDSKAFIADQVKMLELKIKPPPIPEYHYSYEEQEENNSQTVDRRKRYPISIASLLISPGTTNISSIKITANELMLNKDSFAGIGNIDILDLSMSICSDILKEGDIPPLKHLVLPGSLSRPLLLKSLPSQKLESLSINHYEHYLKPDQIPSSVRKINISHRFFWNKSIEKSLPTTVQSLTIKLQKESNYHLRRLNNKYFIMMAGVEDCLSFTGGIISVKYLDYVFKNNICLN